MMKPCKRLSFSPTEDDEDQSNSAISRTELRKRLTGNPKKCAMIPKRCGDMQAAAHRFLHQAEQLKINQPYENQ